MNSQKSPKGCSSHNAELKTIAILNSENLPAQPWEDVAPGLIAKTADGLRATRRTSLRLYFRPLCQSAVVVETRLTSTGDESFLCIIGSYNFSLGGSKSPGAKITLDRWPIAVTGKCRLPAGQHLVRCSRLNGVVLLALDGQVVLETQDPRANESIPDLEYFLPDTVTIHEAIVKGKSAALKGIPLNNSKSYNLYMCIDFFDDLISAPWTERTLREVLEIYNRHNIRRIYFIDHGGFKSGFWDHYDATEFPIEKHGRETFQNLGDILPAVVAAGHKAGLEVYALYKPQECGFAVTYPYGSEKARQFGKAPRLDGMMWWVMDFVAKHPEMRLERDMRPIPPDLEKRIIGKIVLVSEEGLTIPFDPRRIRLWVSADNGSYVPYAGPMEIKVAGKGKIILERLAIKEKFMALTVAGEPTRAFGNTLRKLVEIYDQEGRKLPISYADATQLRNLPIEKAGFTYDYPSDTTGEMDNYFWLDSGKPLAIAKGWERYLCGVICEAYPEVRHWWMENIEYYIKTGVDGVDIRDLVHTRTFDWDVFGFNKPLAAAFKAKHGVDILNQPFQREDLRRLRGEYYTEFLRQARQRLTAAGKKMHLHISPRMKSPDWHTELDLYQDWEGWLREGLADEITMKMNWFTGEVAAKSFEAARALGLPINYCPYMNDLFKHPNAKALVNYIARQALDTGSDGFIFYENAALMAAKKDGRMEITQSWMLDILKQYAGK